MWIEPITGTVFTLHSQIRAAFPNTSLPAVLSDAVLASVNIFPVQATAPGHDPVTHAATQTAPVKVGNNWVQQWSITELPADLVAANEVAATAYARAQAKLAREAAVAAIRVTTQAGHTFDGDETSQGRMVRAIVALNATASQYVTWVLADNSTIQATAAELTEALALAGAAQAAIWVL